MTMPAIITVAITGSLPRKADNPAVPISVAEQVEATHAAFEAGAALVHIHVRNDDGSASSDPDRFARVIEGVRATCPGMIVQVSTGGRSGSGRSRGAMLALRPDMASLSVGSVNFPTRVYDNPPDLVDWLAAEMHRHAVRPEIEVFDLSHIYQAAAMVGDGRLPPRPHLQFVMGVRNALPADRDAFDILVDTARRTLPDATWTAAGIGRHQLTLHRWALDRGGHLRTGLEDNVRLDRATLAPSNAALVARAAAMCKDAGRAVATPAEARALLSLDPVGRVTA